jgi:hypothetical protein
MRIAIVATALFLVAGCGKKPTAATPHLKAVDSALSSAGFKLDKFSATSGGRFAANTCASGTLDGVEAVICDYGEGVASQTAKTAAEDWIATAETGTVLTRGHTMLALADRQKTDPNGKVIHRATKAYSSISE